MQASHLVWMGVGFLKQDVQWPKYIKGVMRAVTHYQKGMASFNSPSKNSARSCKVLPTISETAVIHKITH